MSKKKTSLKSRIQESARRRVVSLKRKPSTIPMTVLVIAFLVFSLNLTSMSNTTAKIQGSNMGLAQFAIMLLSLLSILCLMNAFPRRKKTNIPMLVLMFLMLGGMVLCDIHYRNAIWTAVTRAENPIVVTADTSYILSAYNLLQAHMILIIVTAALVALMPVYTRLLKKINTSVDIADNGAMEAIEITE